MNFSGAVAGSVGSVSDSSLFQLTLLDIYGPLPVWSVLTTGILICCTGPF